MSDVHKLTGAYALDAVDGGDHVLTEMGVTPKID